MNFHISQFLSPGRKEFVKGTLLLTGAGLFCRVLGFFYRIYMSRTIGAEGLGLYNMIHPLFSIAFAVCARNVKAADAISPIRWPSTARPTVTDFPFFSRYPTNSHTAPIRITCSAICEKDGI